MFIIDTSRLDPPYDKKGRVTPVTGISPTTTIRLRIVWNAIENVNPNDRYFAKLSSCFMDVLNPLYIIVMNRVDIIITPMNPNSSLIIEKIKSVWGSGR